MRIELPLSFGHGKVLVFDTDDVTGVETPHDIMRGTDGRPAFEGTSHLNLTLKPGGAARWEDPSS